MIKLISKSILLLSIILLLSELGWKALALPYYWGNIQLNTKLEYLKERNIDPDNYFLGSSVTFRQVMPTLFDSIVGRDIGYSFNLGCDGLFPPQTYLLLEHLMEEDTSINYLFVELSSYDFFGKNFRTTNTKYYLTPQWLAVFYPYITASSVSLVHKLGISGMYLYAYFEKALGLGMRKDYLKQISEKNTFKGETLVGKYKDGFYRLGTITADKKELEELPAYLKKMQRAYELAYKAYSPQPYNSVLKKQLDHYLLLAKEKNIHLIYILNSVESVFDNVAEMVALFEALPDDHKIDLANPNIHPELYLLENRWDRWHLNEQGSILFSSKLAQAFNQMALD